MIYSLNVEVFKFHPYDIANINKAIERFGISVIDRNGYYSVERDNTHIIINDGDFIVVSPSADISSYSGLPVYEFKAYTNDRFIRLMEMNNQLKELTDKVFSYNPKKDPRDPIFGKHNIRKNGEKKMDKIVYEFDPKIYPRSLFVMKGCEPKDVIDRFTTRDDSEIEIEMEVGSEPSMTTFPMVRFKDTGKYGELVVVWIDDKDVDLSMISHEAFHVSMDILSELGIKFHADNQEPIAYMVGWCVRCISDVVSGKVGISD